MKIKKCSDNSKRSAPSIPRRAKVISSLFHVRVSMQRLSPAMQITPGSSESDLAAASDLDKDSESLSSKRHKRRIDRGLGMNDLFNSFKEELTDVFETKFSKLYTELQDLKKQNLEICRANLEISKSIEFMSAKYEEMKNKCDMVIKERDENKMLISSLEEKIENLEKNARSSCIEIKNIPKEQGETKANIMQIVSSIGSALKINIQPGEIKDAYRIASKKEGVPTMLVKFSTVIRKEEVLESVKKFNKQSSVKFNTQHIGLKTTVSPIYITEYLTPKTSKLFFQCREFARSNGYTFCWCARSKIFLRKKEGDRFIIVQNEKQLNDLKTKT